MALPRRSQPAWLLPPRAWPDAHLAGNPPWVWSSVQHPPGRSEDRRLRTFSQKAPFGRLGSPLDLTRRDNGGEFGQGGDDSYAVRIGPLLAGPVQ